MRGRQAMSDEVEEWYSMKSVTLEQLLEIQPTYIREWLNKRVKELMEEEKNNPLSTQMDKIIDQTVYIHDGDQMVPVDTRIEVGSVDVKDWVYPPDGIFYPWYVNLEQQTNQSVDMSAFYPMGEVTDNSDGYGNG
jgi:ABC-type Fe3+-hydroxamate transport system substrate-binding protein